MQELMQNKLVVGLIVLAAVGLIYTYATGGFSGGSGDMPEFETASVSTPSTPSSATTTPPVSTSTPPPVDTTTPSTPSTASPVDIGTTAGTQTTAPSTPSTPSVKPPATSTGDTGINEKLQAFRRLYPGDIIEKKYDVLEKEVTKPENFAEDIGRVDPLTVVNDFIPEELRPPRSGETSDEEMFEFLEEAIGYEILDSIQIQVVEVLQVGNYRSVVCLINGQGTNLAEGQAVGANGVTIQAASVSREEVVFMLYFTGAYTSVSKARHFISGSY